MLQALRILEQLRAQYYSRARLDVLIARRLQQIVYHAYETVPYYRSLFDKSGVKPEAIRKPTDLACLPVTTKADLQQAGADCVTSQAYDPSELKTETTSGSSGRPLAIRFDPGWLKIRQAMFLRALTAAGYRPGMPMLLIASQDRRSPPFWLRWRHISFRKEPEDMLDVFNAFRPRFLYGWVTPIRRMAEVARARPHPIHRANAIITTAETLDSQTRRLIETAFGCPVFQIYGMTEMGAMSWECNRHDGLHLAEDLIFTEYLPHESRGETARLVTTNLGLRGMPFLRYDCGDLAVPVRGDVGSCGCGRGFQRLRHVEGRIVDCIELSDGRTFSPYDLTMAMERVNGIAQYQIRQTARDRLEVRFVTSADAGVAVQDAEIRRIVGELVGTAVHVTAIRTDRILPAQGTKFRVVESLLDDGTST